VKLPKSRYAILAWVFVALFALDLALQWFGLLSGLADLLSVVLFILGIILGIRFLRHTLREAIWRLRNRLIVTYLFIAVVPILLILSLVAVGTWLIAGQVAVYLVSSELERRAGTLEGPARFLAQARAANRAAILQQMAPLIEEGLPGFEAVGSDGGTVRYPPSSQLNLPAANNWKSRTGYLRRNGHFYCFSLAANGGDRALLMAPIDGNLLGKLVPGIGVVSLNQGVGGTNQREVAGKMPERHGFLDFNATWFGQVPFRPWDSQGDSKDQTAFLVIQTRPSAVLNVLFRTQSDDAQIALYLFAIIATLLLIVWVLSVVIGLSLTRSITGAVHDIYEGTGRIAKADFGYRIPVKGKDQLAALGTSFNNMTTQLEDLVEVAKEKERLQSEVQIASEVQNQLFPRSAPAMKTIELFGACQPARMVSGDYFDYLCLPNGNLALAIGDVAGKGISAALLMASIQSIMRTQLAAGDDGGRFSTSRMVAQLNRQLYASTAPEKYATFFFGVYDEASRLLTYTNAGHLPPLLVRDGATSLLDVTGTVVGLFPSMAYKEESIRIERGDLLIGYTDGITEPENDYGEEFGAERLAEVASQYRGSQPNETVRKIMDAVTNWSTAPELPDDMTVLIAKGIA
jgi:sigma-B regulation protein RsbU (phosphoserine phosphatase)